MNYKYTYESPLGTMIMLGTLTYLTDLFFVDKKYQYSVNDEGKIKNLTFSYNKTKEEEQALTDQLEKSAQLGEINMNELTPVKLASMFNSFNASKFVAESTTLGDVSGRIDTVNINNQTLSNFIVFALRRNKIPASIASCPSGSRIIASFSLQGFCLITGIASLFCPVLQAFLTQLLFLLLVY